MFAAALLDFNRTQGQNSLFGQILISLSLDIFNLLIKIFFIALIGELARCSMTKCLRFGAILVDQLSSRVYQTSRYTKVGLSFNKNVAETVLNFQPELFPSEIEVWRARSDAGFAILMVKILKATKEKR